jgi:hypothetical protein
VEFTKIVAGWYATEDGRFAVINDGIGHVTINEYEGADDSTGTAIGVVGGEWAFAKDEKEARLRVDNNAGENVDWFATKREAVEAANDYERRNA